MEGIIRDVIGGGNLLASVYFLVIERADYGYCLVPIETRYLNQMIDDMGNIIGKKVMYEDDMLYFPNT
ncbi:MAG: hypothetical protein GW803_02390 [Caldiserica bacterium]|jgi:hypothetical protein|nr:hypothetical protein [Caldisericota bacterium]